MINLKVVNVQSANGVVTGYELSDGSKCAIYSKDYMKNMIKTGVWSVEGFEIDSAGRLQDRRHCDKKPVKSRSDLDKILTEIRLLRQSITPYDDSSLKQELVDLKNNNIDYLLLNELSSIKKDLVELKLAQEGVATSIDSYYNKIEEKLEKLGITTDEQLAELKEKFKFLFEDRTYNGTIKYPRNKDDIHKDIVYYDRDMTLNDDDFRSVVESSSEYMDYDFNDYEKKISDVDGAKALVKLDFVDKGLRDRLREHIEYVNALRLSTESAYRADIVNEARKGYTEREKSEVDGLMNACLFMGALGLISTQTGLGSLDALATSGMGAVLTAKGVVSIKSFLAWFKAGVNSTQAGLNAMLDSSPIYGDSVHSHMRTYRNKSSAFSVRSDGIYSIFSINSISSIRLNSSTDLNDLMTRKDLYDADIRLFVINYLGCLQRRKALDTCGTHFFGLHRDIPYASYINNSLAITDKTGRVASDERLFNFYCQYFIAKYIKVNRKATRYALTQTGITSYKAYMDILVNAYFAAKKSLVFYNIDGTVNGDRILRLSTIMNSLSVTSFSEQDKKDIDAFLRMIKLGMVIQGMQKKKAEYILRQFIKISNLSDIY